jgi:superfamily II DNA or RNA helicase
MIKYKLKQNNEYIWKSIEPYFNGIDIDMSKLDKQLDLFLAWALNKGVGYIEACTGFGKTIEAIIAIIRFNLRNPQGKTIIVVPNSSLLKDWVDPKNGHIKNFNLQNVKVYVVNTYTMSDVDRDCDFLIIDEAHRYAREESQYFSSTIKLTKYKYLMALSATLGAQEKKFLESFNIPKIGEVTLEEAEKNGWISKFVIFNYGVDLGEEDDEQSKRLTKLHNQYYAKFNFDFYLATACNVGDNIYFKHKGNGTTMTGKQWRQQVANQFNLTEKDVRKDAGLWLTYMRERKTFLHKAYSKEEAVVDILNNVGLKAIVFSEYTEIVDNIQKRIGKESICYHSNIQSLIYSDISLNNIIGKSVKTISGTKYKIDNDTKLYEFKEVKKKYPNAIKLSGEKLKNKIKKDFETDKYRVLLTSKALDEGYNCKNIEMGIIHSGSSLKRQTIQRFGRILRFVDGKVAIIVNIYVKDSQDEKWLNERLKGISSSKINWVTSANEINHFLRNNLIEETQDFVV